MRSVEKVVDIGSVRSSVMREAELTMAACNLCGKCVKSCSFTSFLPLMERKPAKLVEKKFKFLRTGEWDEDIRQLIFSCVQCDKCASVCPEELSPHMVNYACKIRWVESKKVIFSPEMQKCFARNRFSFQRLVTALTLKPSDIKIVQEVPSDSERCESILYLGCSILARPDLIIVLVNAMGLSGFNGVIISGPELCCGRIDQLGGDVEGEVKNSKKLINTFNSLRAKEVICWCPNCYHRIKNYLGAWYPFEFRLKPAWEFLAENIGKWQFKNSIEEVVSYQDPCGHCTNGIFDGARKIIRSIQGVQFREMELCRERAVCCSGNTERLLPQIAKQIAEKRVIDAAKTGAKILITGCEGCERRFSNLVGSKYGLAFTNLLILISRGCGLGYENVWERLRASKDVEYIIEKCKKAIEESPFSEEDIRRELPRYL